MTPQPTGNTARKHSFTPSQQDQLVRAETHSTFTRKRKRKIALEQRQNLPFPCLAPSPRLRSILEAPFGFSGFSFPSQERDTVQAVLFAWYPERKKTFLQPLTARHHSRIRKKGMTGLADCRSPSRTSAILTTSQPLKRNSKIWPAPQNRFALLPLVLKHHTG